MDSDAADYIENSMKVVIVGAGPAGLVTCKTLLESSSTEFPFNPLILEQEDDIGGQSLIKNSQSLSLDIFVFSGTFRYRSYEVCTAFPAL